MLGFTGFKQVVDEQGGIPIVVPKTVVASHAATWSSRPAPRPSRGAQALA